MDIIDIMMAKALTPQGQVDTYAAKARRAAQDAENAATAAQTAVDNIESITEQTVANNELATQTINDLNNAIANLPQEATVDTGDIDDEISKLAFELHSLNKNDSITNGLKITYPDDQTRLVPDIIKLYKSEGVNEDGTMTQKAIKEYVSSVKQTLDERINNIPTSGGGTISFSSDDAGKIVVIDENGRIITGTIDEAEIIEALIRTGAYTASNAVGLVVDYENKLVERSQEAVNLAMGADFDHYIMYGGRMRCNVADDGRILAFYGDEGFADDGSNGQVMIYQPKFYYQRTLIKADKNTVGKTVRKESYIISPAPQTGFKLHPIFINELGEELDYVLVPSYDGSIVDDKLSSVAGQKPVSHITIAQAEALAQARGTGWHITNMAAESANQMLAMIEFGSLNGQLSLESGITAFAANGSVNCSSITGSTASLGNGTGAAASTINEINGTRTSYNTAGKRAISYRGMENPWGNLWHFIGGLNIYGDGTKAGGVPYICKNYNYDPAAITSDYESVKFSLPSVYGWISAMGYGNPKYDWVLMPAECSTNANSVAPVGDNLWTVGNLNAITIAQAGGTWAFGDNAGLFYYGCDHTAAESSQHSYGAKLMYIPRKGAIYDANYELWQAKVGG